MKNFAPESARRSLCALALFAASQSAYAADHVYNFDCRTIPDDGRNRNSVSLPAGDTATINVDLVTYPCDWAYTSGNITPTSDGGPAVAVYHVGSIGPASLNVYRAGVGGYVWDFVHPLLPQSITFAPAPTIMVGGTGTVSATASSGLPVSYNSATPDVCTVDAVSGVVTGVSAALCTIVAGQYGDTTYAVAQAEQSFSIGPVSAVPMVAPWALWSLVAGLAGLAAGWMRRDAQ